MERRATCSLPELESRPLLLDHLLRELGTDTGRAGLPYHVLAGDAGVLRRPGDGDHSLMIGDGRPDIVIVGGQFESVGAAGLRNTSR